MDLLALQVHKSSDPQDVQALLGASLGCSHSEGSPPLNLWRMNDEIWTAKDCAAYLKCSPKHFLRQIRFSEGFPAQLTWSIPGRPKWSAEAVKGWALRPDYATAA